MFAGKVRSDVPPAVAVHALNQLSLTTIVVCAEARTRIRSVSTSSRTETIEAGSERSCGLHARHDRFRQIVSRRGFDVLHRILHAAGDEEARRGEDTGRRRVQTIDTERVALGHFPRDERESRIFQREPGRDE